MTKSSLFIALLLYMVSQSLWAQIYWVTKGGDDANNCTNATNDACLTIQKGVSLLAAGDTLNVGPGIYTDDGGLSPYAPAGAIVGWMDNNPPSSNVVIDIDGSPGNLITLQAMPGSEGSVTIDGENQRLAIHLQNSDYVRISGFNLINSVGRAIASWGQTSNAVADPSRLSVGVIIENNKILDTYGDFGTNVNGIAMWGSQDWVVRNNFIDNVYEVDIGTNVFNRYGVGIQAYGVINALVENNRIGNVAHGIFWKDHFITDLATRGLVVESEIRFNKIQAQARPVYIGIRGTDSVEAGDNYVHHNIMYGYNNEAGGVHSAMAGAFAQSGDLRIEHNLMDGEGNTQSRGIVTEASRSVSVTGNIFIQVNIIAQYTAYNGAAALGKLPLIDASDYNIHHRLNTEVLADWLGNTAQNFATLADWQLALSANLLTLNFDFPDSNSISEIPANMFDNLNNKEYRYKAGSPAFGFMPDGSNAGPYQLGTETIGLLAQWPGGSIDVLFRDSFE